MKEEFKKIGDETHYHMERCPFCGNQAELWEHQLNESAYRKVVMCSNGGDGLNDEGCPMYMPPEGFYRATKTDALNAWNMRNGTYHDDPQGEAA